MLTLLRQIGDNRNQVRAFAARVILFRVRLRSILCARRLHLLAGLRQHRVGFLGGDWTIDQKIETIVAQFHRRGIVIDNGDDHRVAIRRRLASPPQQEARLRLVSPVSDHA